MDPDVKHVLAFLTHLYEVEGLGYSSINIARSAISSLCCGKVKVGQNHRISEFITAIANLRQVIPRNKVIWDTSLVLKFLEHWHPAKNLSLRQLSIKTVLLCLLVSGQRGQTIWLMDERNIVFEKESVRCSITAPLKTSNPRHHIEELCFKRYSINKALCVYHYLKHYRQRTEPLRAKSDKNSVAGKGGRGSNYGFFLRTIPPHSPICRGTLTSWTKEGLRLSGVDVSRFTPHSTRSASTSKAKRSIGLATILKTAGWRNATTFARFYDKQIEKQGWGVEALI